MIGGYVLREFGHRMAGEPMPISPTKAGEMALVAQQDIGSAREAARADRAAWFLDVARGAAQNLYGRTVGLILSEGE